MYFPRGITTTWGFFVNTLKSNNNAYERFDCRISLLMCVICQFSAARCTFESNQCGWTNTDKDNFDWKRKQGSTPSIGTGPSVDHTLGTNKGYFVYIETSFGSIGDRARFLSPLFKKVCIFFIEQELRTMWHVHTWENIARFFLSRFDYDTFLSLMIALINFDSSLVNVMTIHAGLHSFHSVYCFGVCLWYGITGNNNKKSATCLATLLQN